MATVNDVSLAIIAKIFAETSIVSTVTLGMSTLFKVPAGSTWGRGRTLILGKTVEDSNVNQTVMHVTQDFVHNLSDPTDETTYLTGDAGADQEIMMARSFWLGVTGVYGIEDGPEIEGPERIGNYIIYTTSVQLAIEP